MTTRYQCRPACAAVVPAGAQRSPLALDVMRTAFIFLAAAVFGIPASWAQVAPKTPSKYVALTYDDPRATEFHKQVLTAIGLPYKVEEVGGRKSVWWAPRSEAEAIEVQMRISQYLFAVTNFPSQKWPTPETKSGTIKSC